MKYITVKEAANNWNISEVRVRKLIRNGRIGGAIKLGTTWNIPGDTSKPIDKRVKDEEDFEINIPDNFFEKIYEKEMELESKQQSVNNVLKSLRKKYILDWIYNSNAIEGNTLTFAETKKILNGIAVGGKSMREHLEVINHRDAIIFVEELVKKGKSLRTNIKNINKILLRGIDNENAGKYRTEKDNSTNNIYVETENSKISEQMEQLIIKYDEWCQDYEAIES